jgi:hypothetical protein
MKSVLIALAILIIAPAARADVIPDEPSNETAGAAAIATSLASTMLNITSAATHSPSYWMGGVGIALGVGTLALTAAEDPAYEMGLWAAGTTAIASGLMALRYRHILGQEKHTRLEPTWTDGAPGLAFVVDF